MMDLQVDEAHWNKALEDYASITHKTAEEAIFHQTKNLLFFVAKRMRNLMGWKDAGAFGEAMRRRGYDLDSGLADSCRIVAWLLRKRIESGKIAPGAALPATRTRQGKKQVLFATEKTRGGKVKGLYRSRQAKFYSREYAQKFARKEVRARKSRVGFATILPYRAVEVLVEKMRQLGYSKVSVAGLRKHKASQLKAAEGWINVRRDARGKTLLTLNAQANFKGDKTSAEVPMLKSVAKFQGMLDRVLHFAIRDTLLDMDAYMERKMRQRLQERQ